MPQPRLAWLNFFASQASRHLPEVVASPPLGSQQYLDQQIFFRGHWKASGPTGTTVKTYSSPYSFQPRCSFSSIWGTFKHLPHRGAAHEAKSEHSVILIHGIFHKYLFSKEYTDFSLVLPDMLLTAGNWLVVYEETNYLSL